MNSSSERNDCLNKYFFKVDIKDILSTANSAIYSGSSLYIFALAVPSGV
jgi:hypothetical protein